MQVRELFEGTPYAAIVAPSAVKSVTKMSRPRTMAPKVAGRCTADTDSHTLARRIERVARRPHATAHRAVDPPARVIRPSNAFSLLIPMGGAYSGDNEHRFRWNVNTIFANASLVQAIYANCSSSVNLPKVGAPKGRLSRFEKQLLIKPWSALRPGLNVKLPPQHEELYVFAQSRDPAAKERTMRKRRLKQRWTRLVKLSTMTLIREALFMKLGAARGQSPSA